jgi:hypothetical protein
VRTMDKNTNGIALCFLGSTRGNAFIFSWWPNREPSKAAIINRIWKIFQLFLIELEIISYYCISQKAWTLFWKMIFAPAFTSHSYGVLGNLVGWNAKISMVLTIFQSSKYETGLWEEKNKSMDVQHIWETQ